MAPADAALRRCCMATGHGPSSFAEEIEQIDRVQAVWDSLESEEDVALAVSNLRDLPRESRPEFIFAVDPAIAAVQDLYSAFADTANNAMEEHAGQVPLMCAVCRALACLVTAGGEKAAALSLQGGVVKNLVTAAREGLDKSPELRVVACQALDAFFTHGGSAALNAGVQHGAARVLADLVMHERRASSATTLMACKALATLASSQSQGVLSHMCRAEVGAVEALSEVLHALDDEDEEAVQVGRRAVAALCGLVADGDSDARSSVLGQTQFAALVGPQVGQLRVPEAIVLCRAMAAIAGMPQLDEWLIGECQGTLRVLELVLDRFHGSAPVADSAARALLLLVRRLLLDAPDDPETVGMLPRLLRVARSLTDRLPEQSEAARSARACARSIERRL
eukprot:m51a1_g12118 hypothetical protein (395) ;mRNA; r:993-2715